MSTEATEQRKFPVQVMGDRVMVLLIHEMGEDDIEQLADGTAVYKKKGSDILLPDSVKKSLDQLKAQEPQKLVQGLVMSVGQLSTTSSAMIGNLYNEGDTVWCFPNTFDAKMMVDGVEYTIYKEKAIVAKDI